MGMRMPEYYGRARYKGGQTAMKTFEDIAQDVTGTIYEDYFDEGIRVLIMRGPCSLCAYLGVPVGHPLAGHSYEDLSVEAHGGLTFASEGGRDTWPEGWYWYGIDYAHAGDYNFYFDEHPSIFTTPTQDKKWTVEEVKADLWGTIYDFKKLVRLSETIAKQQIGKV